MVPPAVVAWQGLAGTRPKEDDRGAGLLTVTGSWNLPAGGNRELPRDGEDDHVV